MVRTTLSAAAIALSALTASALAEIRSSKCRLIKYGDTTTVETFNCDFRQSGGNVQVWSDHWNFEFPYAEQGKTFIRINRIPLTFTRTGQYTLEVTQISRLHWSPAHMFGDAINRQPLEAELFRSIGEDPLGENPMEPRRLELLTPCMPCRCSTSWAMAP